MKISNWYVSTAALGSFALLLSAGLAQPAEAKGKTAVGRTGEELYANTGGVEDLCWTDAKTGELVTVVPQGIGNGFDQQNALEEGHAHSPRTGQNFNIDKHGDWVDSGTGDGVPTVPLGVSRVSEDEGHAHN